MPASPATASQLFFFSSSVTCWGMCQEGRMSGVDPWMQRSVTAQVDIDQDPNAHAQCMSVHEPARPIQRR